MIGKALVNGTLVHGIKLCYASNVFECHIAKAKQGAILNDSASRAVLRCASRAVLRPFDALFSVEEVQHGSNLKGFHVTLRQRSSAC